LSAARQAGLARQAHHETTAGERLHELIEELAHVLPVQGPIAVFIHHNTLHAFEHLPFEQAVVKAARLFGTEPFRTEDAYRAELAVGRIRDEDLADVLGREPNTDVLPGRLDRRALRRIMLLRGGRRFVPATIRWRLEEGDLAEELKTPENSRLFSACQDRMWAVSPAPIGAESLAGERAMHPEAVHPLLIRLCSVYLDQGIAYWPMPDRELGFYRSVRALFSQPGVIESPALAGVAAEFRRQAAAGHDAEQAILSLLGRLGIPETEWHDVLQAELLALPGWAGLMRRLEGEPDLAPHVNLPCSLSDFLAVRLTLAAVTKANSSLEPKTDEPDLDLQAQRLAAAAQLYDAAQLMHLSASDIQTMTPDEFGALWREIETFDDFERRRLLHLAYELRHERDVLRPMARHRADEPPVPFASRPAAQVIFCIDEREESIRRQLEEVDPAVETLGAAGFFGIAMNYKGLDDAHGVALCPVVVRPAHAVREVPAAGEEPVLARRAARRRLGGRATNASFVSSRTFVRGWLNTTALGPLYLFPLVARLLSPRLTARFRQGLHKSFVPAARTELALTRTPDQTSEDASHGGEHDPQLAPGFLIEEQVDRLAAVLSTAGLKEGFARLVVILGHGSTSLNNPHESAHDCGACGGRRGGPNARSFAAIANRPEVRAALRDRGVCIPDDTWFVGGYHDTCNDEVELYDTTLVPATHGADLARIRRSLDQARALSAHERARRFEAAFWCRTPGQALRHMEARAEHLAEPRPEYGHCTNAICVVGRRAVTRGLFLDRRAFLVSYDAALDPEDRNLLGVLSAVIPVCGGISLEYYFSYVDNEGYGCGTKLPHNVTSLLGVMNGAASDLRTGLPWQMVEIHEPVRILFVIETTPERLSKVIAANPELVRMVENEWIRLSTMDPLTGEVHVYRKGRYERLEGPFEELPEAPSSPAWYGGKMEHLPIARIRPTIAT
jgi:uncharacterized protein YbcC (UPF0753/DUF2309 family)